MALIVSIETSTKVCSVALHAASQLIATQTLHIEKSHAESLPLAIEHLMDISPYTKKDLTAVAVSCGPGSYTGLRIGISVAKGLCYALQIPLIAINTLEAMVGSIQPYNTAQALLCPMLDARRMEVYCLISDIKNNILLPTHARVIDRHSFQSWFQDTHILFFGDGVQKCKPLLAHHDRALFIDHHLPQAHYVGDLAYTKFQQAAFEDLAYFTPLYLKPFQGN